MLLQKWRWHFFNEDGALWCNVIKAIDGEFGGLDSREVSRVKTGTWARNWIGKLYAWEHILPRHMLRYNLVSGDKLRFWKDIWLDDQPLSICFPRIFRLENIQIFLVRHR